MLILLPPSAGKTAPTRGRPLDLAALSHPELNPARQRVLDALITLSHTSPDQARLLLGLSDGQSAEVARNAGLRTAPTAAAAKIYTGVLYEALDLATLPASPVKRSLRVFSNLWGVLGVADRIPAYRCPAGVSLPGLGGLGSLWRKEIPADLDRGELVVDLRSGPYAAMWRPRGRHAVVRVWHERESAGVTSRTVVSHFNKATKGRLVRDLAISGARPRSAGELVSVLRDLKYTVETDGNHLDVVVNQL